MHRAALCFRFLKCARRVVGVQDVRRVNERLRQGLLGDPDKRLPPGSSRTIRAGQESLTRREVTEPKFVSPDPPAQQGRSGLGACWNSALKRRARVERRCRRRGGGAAARGGPCEDTGGTRAALEGHPVPPPDSDLGGTALPP
ncbi:hypothetical protein NDU88_003302 [Pleurodeles waltl]|uniref:Uncharacterized protein n=1 Tax=Pleurodeles waltl TaxID=8319 RepID=A0AAV7QF32_PLEWA|nr:hypothetical protein NDU88_003302 [Pleurodeles waltl]